MNPSSPQTPHLSFKAFKTTPCQSLPLKEIVDIITGKPLSKKQLSPVPTKNNPYPVIAGGLYPLGYYHQYNSDPPAITIIRKGSVGLCFYHEDKMWYSNNSFLLKIKPHPSFSLNLLYLYYLLKAKEPQLKQLKTGTSVPGIQKQALLNFKITLTPYLEHQNQIATFLSLLEQQIKLEHEILTLYQTQQKYYLHRLITAQLKFKAFKTTPCQFLPLKEIVDIITGKPLSKKQLSPVPTKNNPYPVIAGGLYPLGYYHQYNSDPPAITIIRKGSIGLCFYHEDKMWYSNNSFLLDIKPNSTVSINLLYLYYLLKAKEPQLQQLKTGTSVPGIQKPTLLNFKITLTPHLEHQNQIADFLSLLEQQIKLENELLTLYQTQKKYYLHQMFV